MTDPHLWLRRLALLAIIVVTVPLAFIALTSLLMWSTVIQIVRTATHWSP